MFYYEYFLGSRTQAFPTPPCLCEPADMELLPQLSTMVLPSVTLWIHLYDMASIYPRSSLSNAISFLKDDLDTALNNALLVSFRMPHSSRSKKIYLRAYLAYLVHSCRSVGNSLIYADLVSIYLPETSFYILFYHWATGSKALSPFINQ